LERGRVRGGATDSFTLTSALSLKRRGGKDPIFKLLHYLSLEEES
jgi:hypothetical protein